MAHNLMNRNGLTAMFCVGNRDAAWHKLGQRTPDAVEWAQAIKLADLDWTVVKKQMYARNPLGKVVDCPSYATFRSDDGAYLGTVGEGYEIIQNRHAFAFCDDVLKASGGAKYESAGALGNGERIWCLARIPEADFTIGLKDEHRSYLLFATAHDMSMSGVAKLVSERVVCANTLAVALGETGSAFRFKHTANVKQRMDAAVRQLSEVKAAAVALKGKLVKLADTRLTRESVDKIMARLFPKTEGANQTRRDQTLVEVLSLYESNDGNAFPDTAGTAYNLYNAVTEYTDHMRTARGQGSKPEQVAMARAESALFGSGDKLKSQALAVITEETDAYLTFLASEGLR